MSDPDPTYTLLDDAVRLRAERDEAAAEVVRLQARLAKADAMQAPVEEALRWLSTLAAGSDSPYIETTMAWDDLRRALDAFLYGGKADV